MIFVGILAPATMSPSESGAHVALLQNSAGRTSKALKFRGATIYCKFAPQSFRAFKVRPAELWSLQSAPRGVLEQCNMCPAFKWRHSYGGQNIHKKSSKTYL